MKTTRASRADDEVRPGGGLSLTPASQTATAVVVDAERLFVRGRASGQRSVPVTRLRLRLEPLDLADAEATSTPTLVAVVDAPLAARCRPGGRVLVQWRQDEGTGAMAIALISAAAHDALRAR